MTGFCECKTYPHDEWCNQHPMQALKDKLEKAQEYIVHLEAVVSAAQVARQLLLNRLLHGDDAHRQWLIAEIDMVYSAYDRSIKALDAYKDGQ